MLSVLAAIPAYVIDAGPFMDWQRNLDFSHGVGIAGHSMGGEATGPCPPGPSVCLVPTLDFVVVLGDLVRVDPNPLRAVGPHTWSDAVRVAAWYFV